MATDINQIQLSDAERRLVGEIAKRTGKSWTDVIQEALRHYGHSVLPPAAGSGTWYERLSRQGLIACLHGGPADLNTNPAYMEGFGLSDQ